MTIIKKLENIHSLYLITFLFVLTFLAYANTLGNGLFFDDEDFIYKNVYVQNFSVDKYFTQNVIAGTGKISNYYRPLLSLGYGLEYKVFGNSAFIFHLDNLLLHAGAGIALYLLIKKLFNNKSIALLTSILFLIHPIQTEAVSYASGRSDSLAAVFIFLTVIFFYRKSAQSKLLSLLFFIFALLSRETAIVTPALIFIVDIVKTKSFKKSIKSFKQLIPIICIAIGYFLLRLTILNFQNTLNFYDAKTLYSSNIFVRLLTFLSILPAYLGLLIFPKDLHMERAAQVISNPLNPWVVLSFFVILISFFLSLRYFKKHPLFLFCFLWFFVSIFPASGIMIPINGLMYEHFLYLPSIAIFLIISFFIIKLLVYSSSESGAAGESRSPTTSSGLQSSRQAKYRTVTWQARTIITFFGIIFVLIALSVRTISRNTDWHDPITFYNQTLKYNPTVARVHNNLAMSYADSGNNQKAIGEYKTAIRLNDIYPQTHYNLANAYVAVNKIDQAEKEYRRSLEMDPYFYRSYLSLAQIYKGEKKQKEFEELVQKVKTISQKNPTFTEILNYLKSLE